MKGLVLKIVFFIAGFTAVYVPLGLGIALAGSFVGANMKWIFTVAGVILIIFGLHVMRVFRIKWLDGQWGGLDKAKNATSLIGAFLVGVAFAVGWSPCTGPIIGAILTLAASQGKVWSGGLLLLLYCIGLGIPFLLVGLAVGKFLRLFSRIERHMKKVEIASGILLIALGILFLSQHANLLRELTGGTMGLSGIFGDNAQESVSKGVSFMAMGAALLAGFLSFISPCVLPLLPSYVAFIAGTDDLDALMGDD